MAKKLVRCVEGHVYDGALKACPECGAQPDDTPAVKAKPAAKPKKEKNKPSPDFMALAGNLKSFDFKTADPQKLMIGGGVAAVLLLLAGAWGLGLFSSESGTSSDTANTQKTEKTDTGGEKTKETKSEAAETKSAPTETKSEEPRAEQTADRAPLHECDKLAASPFDPDRPEGVEGIFAIKDISPNAVDICRAATEEYPDEGRFWANLGRAYRKAGEHSKAINAYSEGSDKGSLFSAWAIAIAFRDGTPDMQKNEVNARTLMERVAEAGLPVAQADYGDMLARGIGGYANAAQAKEWLLKGAQYSAYAMDKFVDNLENNRLGDYGNLEYRRWMEHGVEIGSKNAMNSLGVIYHNAIGVPQNIPYAAQLYERSANLGNEIAVGNIGVLYENQRNYAEAWRYYDRAAAMGDTNSMIYLGNYLRDGTGNVARDLNEARNWYERAWKAGDYYGLWLMVLLLDRHSNTDKAELAQMALLAARNHYGARRELSSGNGMKRELRSALQTELQNKNFYFGNIDGKFGPTVREAIEAYANAPESETSTSSSAPLPPPPPVQP